MSSQFSGTAKFYRQCRPGIPPEVADVLDAAAPYAGYELDELFDAVVISDRVGLRKPGPAIYELTASKIGLPPGECLFVDDTEANLPPARELGMGTLLFTGADSEVPEIERLIGIA